MGRVHLLALLQLAAAGWLVLLLDGDRLADGGWQVALGVYGAAVVAELFITHLQFRRDSYTFSVGEVPFVIGLAFLAPLPLVLARSLAAATAAAVRRLPPHKAMFNVSVFALETAIACTVEIWLLESSTGIGLAGALVIASLAANTVNAAAMTNVIRMVRPDAAAGVLAAALRMQPIYLSNAFLGVLLVIAAQQSWWLLAAGSLPVVMTWAAARMSAAVQQRVEQLEAVARFTAAIDGADEHRALTAALEHLTSALNVETTVIQLPSVGDRPPIRIELQDDEAVATPVDDDDPLVRLAARLGDAAYANDRDGVRRLVGAEAPAPPFDEALLVPFQHLGATGLVLAAGRLGTSPPFAAADLALGSATVNHLAAVLQTTSLAAELDDLSRHDPVTGLLNARGLDGRLAQQPATDAHAAMSIELLDAHDLVDALGRSAGDAVVREVARRLRHELGSGAVVARTGTSEFLAIVDDCHRSHVGERADRLVDVLRRPFVVDARVLAITPVVGMAIELDGGDLTALANRAEAARAQARRTGAATWLASVGDRTDGRRRLELAAALPEAIERGDVVVLFQPKVDVASRRPVGAEALIRWTHPQHGPVAPPDIVELAERGGVIRRLTDHVVATALRTAGAARAAGHEISIAVNLSPQDLLDPTLVEAVLGAVRRSGLPTSALELEVTEGSVMSDPERAIELLRQLDEAGVHIAVDDYGTGYSSLSYLRRLPVRQVKIDRSFVMGLGDDVAVGAVGAGGAGGARRGDEVIVRSTVDLGHNLGLEVVAEGVETEAALRVLADLGCDIAQGYLFSRPLAADAFAEWLDDAVVAAVAVH